MVSFLNTNQLRGRRRRRHPRTSKHGKPNKQELHPVNATFSVGGGVVVHFFLFEMATLLLDVRLNLARNAEERRKAFADQL